MRALIVLLLAGVGLACGRAADAVRVAEAPPPPDVPTTAPALANEAVSAKPKRVHLEFPGHTSKAGFDSPATYVLDGRVLGRGGEGFDQLLSALRRLPRGSTLVIVPWEGSGPGIRAVGPYWPDAPWEAQKFELFDVLDECGLHFENPVDVGGVFLRRPRPRFRIGRDASPEPMRHHPEFPGYSGRDFFLTQKPARYVLDGRPIGVGDEGFHALLWEMRSWPRGSTLVVAPWADHAPGIVLSGLPSPPPWDGRKFELLDLIDKRGLRMEYPADEFGRTIYPWPRKK